MPILSGVAECFYKKIKKIKKTLAKPEKLFYTKQDL